MLLLEDKKPFIAEARRSDDQNWYMEGIFAQAEIQNKNGRTYPISILEREVEKFKSEMISEKRAVGELNHPQSSSINPDRVAISIELMEKEGNDFIGKARILGTPCGNIIKALFESDVRIGISTRGSGSVSESIVQEDFSLHTLDAVMNPSAPGAMTTAVYENEDVLRQAFNDANLIREFEEFMRFKETINTQRYRQEREKMLVEKFTQFMKLI